MKVILAVVIIACVVFYFFSSMNNQKASKENIAIGSAFLADNKLKDDVTTTAS
ncbi:FKBP-type peptidyl-prolyl cis-trans isomerase N-terminal domain-containing protein, partial [Shewanella sp. 0m-11]